MTRSYQAIDADGHVLEPIDLWDEPIDPQFHGRRPRFVIDDTGKECLSVGGKRLGNPRGIGSLGSIGVRQVTVTLDSLKYAEGKKGGFDPHARILDGIADGIDAADPAGAADHQRHPQRRTPFGTRPSVTHKEPSHGTRL